jgi:cytochrome c-type biogenesis protein CcmH/NrfG
MKPFCVYCGIDLSRVPKSPVCPNCSGPVSLPSASGSFTPGISDSTSGKKFCHQCGTALLPDAKFCQSCGTPVPVDSVSSPKTGTNKPGQSSPSKKKTPKRKDSKQPAGSPLILILGTVGIGLAGLLFLNPNILRTDNLSLESAAPSSPALSKENADRMKQLQQDINKDPNNYSALVSMGNLLFDSQNYSETIQYYQRALKFHPEDANVRVDLGAAYSYLKNIPLAIQETERAIQDSPRHVNAHFNLGIMYSSAGNFAKAKEYWQKTMELAPGSPIAKSAEENIKRLAGMPIPQTATDGRSLYDNNCSKCHELIDPKKYTANEWPAFVDKYGTLIRLPEDEKQKIIEYLQQQSNP